MRRMMRSLMPGELGYHGDAVEFTIAVVQLHDGSIVGCDVMTAPEPVPSDFNSVVYHSNVDPLRDDEVPWQDSTAIAESSPER
jgi:hypothetical protein